MPLGDEIRAIFRAEKKGAKKGKINILPKIKFAWSFRRNKRRKREPWRYKGKMNALWGGPRGERIWEQIELHVISNVSDVTTNFIAHTYESTLRKPVIDYKRSRWLIFLKRTCVTYTYISAFNFNNSLAIRCKFCNFFLYRIYQVWADLKSLIKNDPSIVIILMSKMWYFVKRLHPLI